jgi:hypothetical protein
MPVALLGWAAIIRRVAAAGQTAVQRRPVMLRVDFPAW